MSEHSHSSADRAADAPTRTERDPMQAPWRISVWERGDISRVTITDANSNHVADVYDLDWAACRAKAALIASAPDLLAALKVARKVIDMTAGDWAAGGVLTADFDETIARAQGLPVASTDRPPLPPRPEKSGPATESGTQAKKDRV